MHSVAALNLLDPFATSDDSNIHISLRKLNTSSISCRDNDTIKRTDRVAKKRIQLSKPNSKKAPVVLFL